MKELRCKIKDCSSKDLAKLAAKCGFAVFEGARHSKISTIEGRIITIIPRHNHINPHTAKAIIEDLNRFGANIEIC